VTLAIGSDDATDTSVKEVEFLQSLGVVDNLALLRMWSYTTPRSIFPGRQIGALDEGFEASFVALDGDPVKAFGNVRRIKFRFKQGVLLAPAKTQ
jgi:imidazolonepropionase-like amidohydrolase